MLIFGTLWISGKQTKPNDYTMNFALTQLPLHNSLRWRRATVVCFVSPTVCVCVIVIFMQNIWMRFQIVCVKFGFVLASCKSRAFSTKPIGRKVIFKRWESVIDVTRVACRQYAKPYAQCTHCPLHWIGLIMKAYHLRECVFWCKRFFFVREICTSDSAWYNQHRDGFV